MSRVYVGHLPSRCSERDIERFFKGYGRLKDVVLKNGYGFVEFDNEKDADDAVYDLHGRDMRGERIIVEHARLPPGSRGGNRRFIGRDRRYGPPTRTEYRVKVENLSSRVSWQDLKDLMRKAGDVTYADAHKSARNDGIVEFSSYYDMKEAITQFDGYELHGRRIRVYEERQNRRSRSGSRRSRSGSRGRKNSARSRSHSFKRQKSRSPRRKRERSGSSDQQRSTSRDRDIRKRSRELSGEPVSRSPSRRSDSRGRSMSHRSDKHSMVGDSRSPSRNGRGEGMDKAADRPSRSISRSRSRSRSRSVASRSPKNSRSRSGSVRSRSPDDRNSDQEMNDGRRSDDGQGDGHDSD